MKIKQNQKLRVIVGSFSIYTTAKQVRAGLGDSERSNSATQSALVALEKMRVDGAVGLSGSWNGLNVQIDLA